MATPWFNIGFEFPTYFSGPLGGQNGWVKQLVGVGTGADVAFVQNTLIISGSQTLRLDRGDFMLYTKQVGPHTDYEFKFKFQYIFVGAPNPSRYIQIGLASGASSSALWTFFESGRVILFSPGGGPPAINLGIWDLTSVPREFKVRIDPIGILTAYIDGVPQASKGPVIYLGGDTLRIYDAGAVPPVANIALLDDVQADYNVTTITPTSVIVDDFVVRTPAAVPALKKPGNVFAIKRDKYTVVSWNRVTELEDGTKLENGVVRYDVYRFDSLNETDKFLKKSITTISLDHGDADTVFVDTNPGEHAYQIRAVAVENGIMLESDLSERAVGRESPSQIDEKKELLDRKLFVLGEGRLGENLLA